MLRHFRLAWLVWSGLVAALLGVFALYTRPEFLFTLASQVWSCF